MQLGDPVLIIKVVLKDALPPQEPSFKKISSFILLSKIIELGFQNNLLFDGLEITNFGNI